MNTIYRILLIQLFALISLSPLLCQWGSPRTIDESDFSLYQKLTFTSLGKPGVLTTFHEWNKPPMPERELNRRMREGIIRDIIELYYIDLRDLPSTYFLQDEIVTIIESLGKSCTIYVSKDPTFKTYMTWKDKRAPQKWLPLDKEWLMDNQLYFQVNAPEFGYGAFAVTLDHYPEENWTDIGSEFGYRSEVAGMHWFLKSFTENEKGTDFYTFSPLLSQGYEVVCVECSILGPTSRHNYVDNYKLINGEEVAIQYRKGRETFLLQGKIVNSKHVGITGLFKEGEWYGTEDGITIEYELQSVLNFDEYGRLIPVRDNSLFINIASCAASSLVNRYVDKRAAPLASELLLSILQDKTFSVKNVGTAYLKQEVQRRLRSSNSEISESEKDLNAIVSFIICALD